MIDLDGLRLHAPEYVHDVSGGVGRFVQRPSGYRWALVNGPPTAEDGQPTGALPGQPLHGDSQPRRCGL
ncbi:hypothetical protein I6A84_00655 [Frankia sp. CNm7]|uniref:Uncharacterized protein n=1 Tax=Frankia nepalensis TaxID=1836974 RepID=A0A937UL25_9ACTN|nr:hypothetical protein [Frankia nepalensis]MBL7496665.1 hypothetical protein [Frankia nepalensis]MBL7510693.1 hypothetical protein [Frankia nepalensis]MBL7516674.1 hypothetical protein [Frankia nepalensis]MBL7627404.1 hypothetical protein [Frankia nepalensis]